MSATTTRPRQGETRGQAQNTGENNQAQGRQLDTGETLGTENAQEQEVKSQKMQE